MTTAVEEVQAIASAMPTSSTSQDVAAILAVENEMNDVIVEQPTIVRMMILSFMARTHVCSLGERGIAKTMVVDVLHSHCMRDIEKFYLLMNKETGVQDLCGPISPKALIEDDELRYNVQGFLPTARLAALDEGFKGNNVALNALLGIINERRFKANGGHVTCPLDTLVVTSNLDEYHITGELAPFRDRFAVGLHVKPVGTDDGFKKILRGQHERFQANIGLPPANTILDAAQIDRLQGAVRTVKHPDDVYDAMVALKDKAEKEGLRPSARRYGELMKLMCAQAILNGRRETRKEDLALAQHVLWTDIEDAPKAFELTLDYAGQTAQKAAKLRAALDKPLVSLLELSKSVDPTTNRLPNDKFMEVAEVNTELAKNRTTIEDEIEAARKDGDDTSELDALRREIDDAQATVRKFIGMS